MTCVSYEKIIIFIIEPLNFGVTEYSDKNIGQTGDWVWWRQCKGSEIGSRGEGNCASHHRIHYVLLYCVPGSVSWRHPEEGSWFIQTFVKVTREQAHRRHLLDILTIVRYQKCSTEKIDYIKVNPHATFYTGIWLNKHLKFSQQNAFEVQIVIKGEWRNEQEDNYRWTEATIWNTASL